MATLTWVYHTTPAATRATFTRSDETLGGLRIGWSASGRPGL